MSSMNESEESLQVTWFPRVFPSRLLFPLAAGHIAPRAVSLPLSTAPYFAAVRSAFVVSKQLTQVALFSL